MAISWGLPQRQRELRGWIAAEYEQKRNDITKFLCRSENVQISETIKGYENANSQAVFCVLSIYGYRNFLFAVWSVQHFDGPPLAKPVRCQRDEMLPVTRSFTSFTSFANAKSVSCC